MTPSHEDWAAIALVAFANLEPTPKNWRSFWEGHLGYADEPFARVGVDEGKMGELALAYRQDVLSYGQFPPMFDEAIEIATKLIFGSDRSPRKLERTDRQSRGLDRDPWGHGIASGQWPKSTRREFFELHVRTRVRLMAICRALDGEVSWRQVALELHREYVTPERRLVWLPDAPGNAIPAFSLRPKPEGLRTFIDGFFVRAAVGGAWERFVMCATCARFGFARKKGALRYCGASCRKAASRKLRSSTQEKHEEIRKRIEELQVLGMAGSEAYMQAAAEIGDPEAKVRGKKRSAIG